MGVDGEAVAEESCKEAAQSLHNCRTFNPRKLGTKSVHIFVLEDEEEEVAAVEEEGRGASRKSRRYLAF